MMLDYPGGLMESQGSYERKAESQSQRETREGKQKLEWCTATGTDVGSL